ncbi:zinc-binding dehydrogenase [Streptomyces sp. NPDC097617]|uniref:zinc-binding dehydrogenase n=1 Tax=Streptomyces sp. NPDC097617 TaxID=3366091 RepID=UPI0037FE22E1
MGGRGLAGHGWPDRVSSPGGAGSAGGPDPAEGKLSVPPWRAYPLAEAALAHADLEARRNRGKAVLVP